MPKRFAKIENNIVTNVVVCDSEEWLINHFGGTWIETNKGDVVENFAGKGFFHDENSSARFAMQWIQPTGAEDAYPVGAYVYHSGQIWQSKVADNIWEPGVFGWFDPISEVPKWIQPLGAGSEYAVNDEVMHAGKHWKSNTAANVWEPGVFGWDDITDTSTPNEPQAWVQPTGAHDAYALGAIVTHSGQTWVSDYAANVWEPGVFGWTAQ